MEVSLVLLQLLLVATLPHVATDNLQEFEAILLALKSGKELNFTQLDQFAELSRVGVDLQLPGVDPEANMDFVSRM